MTHPRNNFPQNFPHNGLQCNDLNDVMERLIQQGPDAMAEVFRRLLNLAMRFERDPFLGAGPYERSAQRVGYANGYKPKRQDTPAGTVTLDVPKTRGHEASGDTSGDTSGAGVNCSSPRRSNAAHAPPAPSWPPSRRCTSRA